MVQTYAEEEAQRRKERRELVARAKAFIENHTADEIIEAAERIYDPHGRRKDAQRDLKIARRYYDGCKTGDLAREFNLSYERIRQIAIKIAIGAMNRKRAQESRGTAPKTHPSERV
jgi:Mor family transcriptional regulator